MCRSRRWMRVVSRDYSARMMVCARSIRVIEVCSQNHQVALSQPRSQGSCDLRIGSFQLAPHRQGEEQVSPPRLSLISSSSTIWVSPSSSSSSANMMFSYIAERRRLTTSSAEEGYPDNRSMGVDTGFKLAVASHVCHRYDEPSLLSVLEGDGAPRNTVYLIVEVELEIAMRCSVGLSREKNARSTTQLMITAVAVPSTRTR